MAMRRGVKSAAPNDESYGPQATGIPGAVRVIYVPESQPIVVRNLDPHTAYAATYFDPVSGTKTALATIHPDDAGLWHCPPPAGISHDWVLILESPKPKVQGPKSESFGGVTHELTLANDQLAWHFDWSDGHLRSSDFENKLSGRRFALSGVRELGPQLLGGTRSGGATVRARRRLRGARRMAGGTAPRRLRPAQPVVGHWRQPACRTGWPHPPQMGGGDQPD